MTFPAATCAAVALVATAGLGPNADDLQIAFRDGRVTIVADQVPVRQILEEWARLGQVRVVHLDKLSGPPLTLRLVDVPEARALDVLLRSAAGYMAAPRAVASEGASQFDRVVILATSRPPATSAAGMASPRSQPALGPRTVPQREPGLVVAPWPGGEEPDVAPPGQSMPPGGEGMTPGSPPPNPLPFPGTGGTPPSPEEAPPLTAPQPGAIAAPQAQPQVPAALPRPGFAPLPGATPTPGTTPPTQPPPKKPGGGRP